MMKRLFATSVILCAMLGACNPASVDSAGIADKGVKQYEAGNLNAAMATFQTAYERDPNNARAIYYMALIDIFYRDYGSAVQRLNQAAGIRPDAPIYWYTLANAHYLDAEEKASQGAGDMASISYTDCVRAARKSSEADPYYAEAQILQARCHIGAEEYEEAVEAYAASIHSDPTYKSPQGVTENYVGLGRLYMKFGFYNEASLVLGNGLLNNAGDGQLEASLADVFYDMERYEEALAHYKAAIKNLDKDGENRLHALNAMYGAGASCFELARISKEKGNDREAFSLYDEAKNWYRDYADRAVTESEKLRRAAVLAQIKDIDEILNSVSI